MADILQGLTIALCGSFNQPHATLAKDIQRAGGSYSTTVSASVTHLVVTAKAFASNSSKIKQASAFPNIKIIEVSWLLDSFDDSKLAKEDKYLLNPSGSTAKDKNGKKRARSETPPEDEASASTEEEEKPPAKKQKDEKLPPSKPLHVPVDDECPLAGTHTVFIDDDGTIFDGSLNQTVSGENKNKFYRVQILVSADKKSYRTWTRWGRVGERGQNATLGEGSLEEAKKHFARKFKDKSGYSWEDRFGAPKKGKYTFIERNYEDDSDEENEGSRSGKNGDSGKGSSANAKEDDKDKKQLTSKLPERVQHLMELIFNQAYFNSSMQEMEYDANKLPLGKLSKRTLMAGYERLKEIAELMADPSLATSRYQSSIQDAKTHLSDAFYTVIPHNFGRNRPPVINTDQQLKKEIALLESLSDMEIASGIMKEANTKGGALDTIHLLDRQYAGLGMREMTPLDKVSDEYKLLEEYLLKSHGETHYQKFTLQDIFRIEREGENDRFLQSEYGKIKGGDRRLLWHGSRTTNFGGILSQGLRIAPPEAPVNGYMFGKGVYLADISSKSALYCCPYTSGNTGLLLLCEAELGRPMQELVNASSNAGNTAKQNKMFSTWGKGRTGPKAWKDASCVHKNLEGVTMPDTSQVPGDTDVKDAYLQYNEYIVYDVAQIRLRYLLRVGMTNS